jgi:hypothetical protein
MTRPPRLLDTSSNDALRSLLDSSLDDGPGPNALPKVAAALGLASATATVSGFAVASAGAQTLTAKGAVAAKGAATAKAAALAGAGAPAAAAASAGTAGLLGGGSAVALGKTLLVSMLSAGALSVGAVAVHEYVRPSAPGAAHVERAPVVSRSSQQPSPGFQASQRVRASQAPVTPMPAVVAQPPAGAAAPAVAAQPSPANAGRPASASPAAPQRAGVLAREVRQIDAARQALESKDSAGALAALDSYERSRVVGLLDREALLLKIEALSQQQDLEQAKALARQYLERFPTDTHAPRLRALLGAPASVQAFPNE